VNVLPVLSASEAAAWDTAARTQYRIPSRVLMEAAGRACAVVLAREFPAALSDGVLVVAGAGNNGGDGWVLARALHAGAVPVWVAALDPKTDDAFDNRALARVDGVRELGREEVWPAAAVAVDALLGTGATGPAKGDVLALAERLTAYGEGVPIFAVDGPTGLDLTNGEAHGPVRARVTVTFGGPRRGHLLAREWCGKIVVADIGFPPPDPGWPILVTDLWASRRLPRLQAAMHKGDRGRVTVLGGAPGMTGAALHAARAALAAGAGLVKLVASAETLAAARASLPDVLTVESVLAPELEPAVIEALEWADALVVGPGLGREPPRAGFVAAVLQGGPVPTVIDADALVLLAGAAPPSRERPLVFTPHLGEFRALFGDALADEAANDRWSAASKAAQKVRGTVLLKGVPTVIADLRGPVHVVASGNPGLATGGSGDLLAGFIGAFLARGTAPAEAAALGAHALGRSAEIGARLWTARSLRPADVLAALPDVWRAWANPRPSGPPVLVELERPETA
jgi:NAD(P)H-hydrate epimerase